MTRPIRWTTGNIGIYELPQAHYGQTCTILYIDKATWNSCGLQFSYLNSPELQAAHHILCRQPSFGRQMRYIIWSTLICIKKRKEKTLLWLPGLSLNIQVIYLQGRSPCTHLTEQNFTAGKDGLFFFSFLNSVKGLSQ